MAESPPYYYETEVEWRGEKDLKLYGGKLPPIGAGAPPEFNGREENWSPEHLFVAALNSCYALTLLAIAEFSKVSLVSLSSSAKGRPKKCRAALIKLPRLSFAPESLSLPPTISSACRASSTRPKKIVLCPTRSRARSPSSQRCFTARLRHRLLRWATSLHC